MTLFGELHKCTERVPYGIHHLCLVCGAVWDTDRRKPEYIATVPAQRLEKERREHGL